MVGLHTRHGLGSNHGVHNCLLRGFDRGLKQGTHALI